MSELRVRVVASRDASFDQLFRSLASVSKDTNRMLEGDSRRTHAMQMSLLKSKLAADKANFSALLTESAKVNDHVRRMSIASAQASTRARADAARAAGQIELREATETARKKSQIEISIAKETARKAHDLAVQSARDVARASQSAGGGGGRGRDMGYRMGYWASRNLSPVTPMLSYAGRMAGDIVRGTGIDMSVGTMMQNHVAGQKLATDIANAGYMPGTAGPNGRRVSAADINASVAGAADATALSRGSAREGLQAFVGKTGDLATGRELLPELGKLARATGTDFGDMIDAAGDVANAFGDVPDKGKRVVSVMQAMAGQGKLGAVEIRNLATQMAKLGAASGQFAGTPEQSMTMMGALAQETRQRGGAASATQAATSVMSFMNQFSKGARIAQWKAQGINPFDKSGKIASPDELIMAALKRTGGDSVKMGKLVSDAGARRVTRGFETIYRSTEGTQEQKLAAVAAEFDRLKKAAMGAGEIHESFAASMQTAEAKAQQFQNRLQDMVGTMAERVLPALEKLGPAIESVFGAFTSVTAWLAQNPFAIIPLALGAAIAKSGIEQAIRVGVENATKGLLGQLGGGIGGGVGVVGNAMAGLVIASAAFTTVKVGEMYIDNLFQKKDKLVSDIVAGAGATSSARSELEKATESGNVSKEAIEKAKKRAEENERLIAAGRNAHDNPDIVTTAARGAARAAGQGALVDKEITAETLRINALLEENIRLRQAITNGIDVRISNLPGGGWQGPPTPSGDPPPVP